MKRKDILLATVTIGAGLVGLIYGCDYMVRKTAKGKLYGNTADIPYNKTGLLLGTSKYLSGGYINYYYSYRIQAAASLMRSGKIKYLVISGDNSTKEYDEPTQMRSDLIAAGIDSSRIFLDYAGFRTFDSMIRLREIFGQHAVTVISQPFHNQRALYIASREGIDAIGFNARDLSKAAGFKVQLREKLARVKVFVDYLLHKKPKFLGDRVIIPD